MKNTKHFTNFPLYQLLTLGFILLTFSISFAQNIGINTTGATPNSSALLDVDASPANNKGILIPRVSLTDTADVTTIATPATSLKVYNTNVAMAGGNGAGYYYWSSTKWLSIPAPANGPGASGQVLTSQGTGGGSQWSTLSSGGGGSTVCATCISQTAVGTSGTWATCRNSCIAMGVGWRMPTWDEETYIASGALGTPTGGWQAGYVWTSTPWDARVAGTPTGGSWVLLFESTGLWNNGDYSIAGDCRCVR